MSNEKNLPYAVVCGGVNIDIGAHSFAPLRDRDSNPGRVELSRCRRGWQGHLKRQENRAVIA